MTINISDIKETDLIVDATKNGELDWINMEALKSFLRAADNSLNSIQRLHEYLMHLQKDLFIFDCTNTYLTIFNNTLFAFSKSKHSFSYRMDNLELTDSSIEWKKMNVPTTMLLRLRNIIELIILPTTEDSCATLLTAISSNNPS